MRAPMRHTCICIPFAGVTCLGLGFPRYATWQCQLATVHVSRYVSRYLLVKICISCPTYDAMPSNHSEYQTGLDKYSGTATICCCMST